MRPSYFPVDEGHDLSSACHLEYLQTMVGPLLICEGGLCLINYLGLPNSVFHHLMDEPFDCE